MMQRPEDNPISVELDPENREVNIGVDLDGDRKADIKIDVIIKDQRFWYIVGGIVIATAFLSKLGGLW